MASVGLLAARRHHDDGRVDAGAELATDIERTHPGKHEVEEHDLEALLEHLGDARRAIGRDRDRDAAGLAVAGGEAGEAVAVLRDHDGDRLFAGRHGLVRACRRSRGPSHFGCEATVGNRCHEARVPP